MADDGLFPAVDVPEFEQEVTEYDVQYKKSLAWDPDKGDFIRDGAGRIITADGQDAFRIWCHKIAQTERYRCLAYPDSIGTEMEAAMDNDDTETVQSMVERTITDALLVNPRTEYVRDFEFAWNGNLMNCTFVVKGIEFEEETVITI